MGRIWMPGGGGGADLDVVTAAAGDILKGKVIVGPDGEPLTGVLELTGTAADSQVLEGKTYYNTNAKSKRTGTLINRGAVLPGGLNAGGSYTIPEGYHNGAGKVTANSLASQTDATAGVGDILSGKTAWAKGSKITGTIAIQGAKTASLNCGDSYTIPAGYHNGSGKITANSLASQTSGATAGDADVRNGKTYWKDGTKRTGTMAEKAAATITPGTSNQSIAANQFLTGAQTIKGDTNLVAGNIISGKSIFGVAGNAKVYKSVLMTATSSSSRETFKNWAGNSFSMYYVVFPAIEFTPVMFVCSNSNSGSNSCFLPANTTSMVIACAYTTANQIEGFAIASNCYYGKSGFRLPVYSGNTTYKLLAIGY